MPHSPAQQVRPATFHSPYCHQGLITSIMFQNYKQIILDTSTMCMLHCFYGYDYWGYIHHLGLHASIERYHRERPPSAPARL